MTAFSAPVSTPLSPATDAARLAALCLIRSENVGPVTYHHLVNYYGSPAKALEKLPELARRGGRGRPIVICSQSTAEKEMNAVAAFGARLVIHGEADYPVLLAGIADAPPVLTVRGDSSLWCQRTVLGIVGARNASANGCGFSRKLAYELGQAGYVVASGLARGIDTAAHFGSIESGTVAVVAGGIDQIYPPENERLYKQIAEAGAIIAEAPFGVAPIARHFPARNRIIAGMSVGVAVIEASLKSGSLITAHDALDYGREVFAVPGSPMDPRCKGSNDLIRNGATLTESAQDVIDALGAAQRSLKEAVTGGYTPPPPATASEEDTILAQAEILGFLSPEPVLLDELLVRCNISPSLLYTVLLELELAGRIGRHPGGRVSLRVEM